MTGHQKSALFRSLTVRCDKAIVAGTDGFVSTQTLSFDVGLNTRTIRSELDAAVTRGEAERRNCGPGKAYSYRIKEA